MDSIVTSVPLSAGIAALNNIADKSHDHIWKYGAKIYSQNGEDGILYYLLSALGTTPGKTCIELCAGDGIECNSANLIINHGFTGHLVDGDMAALEMGCKFYSKIAETKNASIANRVRFTRAWVTKENIIELLKNVGFNKHDEVDVLITDIDGNDYWILQEIMHSEMVNPRIICVEYQDIIGPDKALTIPYDPMFNHRRYDCWNGPNYCGASLQAFMHLLKQKYAFVGCEGLGFNGFFVRRDLLNEHVKEMTDISPCFQISKVVMGMKERWPRTKDMQWVDVTQI